MRPLLDTLLFEIARRCRIPQLGKVDRAVIGSVLKLWLKKAG